ncbi:MAG TPA: hypothetical protein DFK15_16010 [Butyricimonas sp.]|uniref:redoxin domain-containing protein n=1 Tax=Butyricimonas TaxID=574697 RepID=UPI000ED9915A|nr:MULTISPECIES: redoxin domain-containing protein [Butyricimonas]HAM84463.1 hypothetical protein [Butyricimonas sp.]HCH90785.1 hypothetical protein [Butyricimonas sp.]
MIKQIFILSSLFLFLSCNTKEKKINDIVKTWSGKEITLPLYLNSDSTNQDSIWVQLVRKKFKILTIVDSNECTECRLKLFNWRLFIQDMDSLHANVSFLFIIYPNNKSFLAELKEKNKFQYPIFYDAKRQTMKMNKFPQHPLFKTFLLDENNKVLLIGDPSNKPPLWNLYKQIITEKLDTRSPH